MAKLDLAGHRERIDLPAMTLFDEALESRGVLGSRQR